MGPVLYGIRDNGQRVTFSPACVISGELSWSSPIELEEESEEKEPIQIGKRVLGKEDPIPPWVKRQKGCDNLLK